jgi:subtilisin
MRRTILLLTLVGAVLLACSGVVLAQSTTPASKERPTSDASQQQSGQGNAIPGQYIVVLKDNTPDPRAVAQEHARAHGAEVLQTYEHALKGYAARIPASSLDKVRNDSRVLFVSEDREVKASAQTTPTGVERIGGKLSSTRSGDGTGTVGGPAGVNVAIIDTGIDTSHPDLNVVGGKNCSTGKSYQDGNGHGTHVAGTVAAKDDANGVVGVAPGANLYAVRVLNNSGSGTWSSVACGIDWATSTLINPDGSPEGNPDNDIKVANMSLGGGGSATTSNSNCTNGNNDALHMAICKSVKAGVTYAVAAGNESDDAANHVPAAYDEVITVSALADFNGQPGGGADATCRSDVDDTFADFSNYGNPVDIAAPGVCIRSTWKGGGYNTISGTSMATPHVTGVAALYKKAHPNDTPAQVRTALTSSTNWESGPINGDPDSYNEGIVKASSF